MNDTLRLIDDPRPTDLPADFMAFLRALGGPALIRVRGEEPRRCRALATLLHGNEPTGAKALHAWLRAGRRPRTSLLCLVASVGAALHEPAFTHRFLPGERDLNRCFRPPFDDRPGRVAEAFLRALESARPEALVDVHNTSGMGPAFGVAPHEDPAHESLAALFCDNLVITDLSLGSLMEVSGNPCPAVTIECGAARDPRADEIARAGLARYLHDEDVLGVVPRERPLELYHHPVRLEFEGGTRLAWAEAPAAEADFTVRPDLERFNFGTVAAGTPVGWLGPRGPSTVRVRNGAGQDVAERYFRAVDGRLVAAQALRFFMVTSSPAMALGDCLLYAAAEREHTRLQG